MKECPDLTKLSIEEKEKFWNEHDPKSLKSLGDRLLAESLPHNPASRPREVTAQEAFEAFQGLGMEPEQLAETLGVTVELLGAWLEDRVKAPESLPFLLGRLTETNTAQK